MTNHLYTIILAAGEGSRVRTLTRSADGAFVPKQFSVVEEHRTMLAGTLERAAGLVPNDRIVVVVARQHELWWRKELVDIPRENVVIQPLNRGTAAGLLLPLLTVLDRDPQARILVLPCDHHVDDEEALRIAIVDALETCLLDSSRILLLGATAREPDTEYGWIVPIGPLDRVRRVAAFVEKPDEDAALALMNRGAVVNTLILAAAGRALMRLYAKQLPELSKRLQEWGGASGASPSELDRLYEALPTHDLSRDVLQLSPDALSVMAIEDCGWSDLGTPARLENLKRSHTRASNTISSLQGPVLHA